MGEIAVDGAPDKILKDRPVAAGIQQNDRLGMEPELLPGDDLQRLVERPQPAGQDHETVGQLEHAVLALVHGGGNDLFCHFVVADLQVLEEFGDDADGLAVFGDQEIDLAGTDTVLPGAGPVHGQGPHNQPFVERLATGLRGVGP